MQSGSRSRIGLPERIRRRISRRRMTDMPLSRPPGASYLGCGFFSLDRAHSVRPLPAASHSSSSVPAELADNSPILSVLRRFGPVKQLKLEKGLLMRRLCKTLGSLSAVCLFITLGGGSFRGLETLASAAPGSSVDAPAASPLGFMPGSREGQLRAEVDALAVPTPENARSWLRTLTAEPHVAGTPADHKTAVFVRDKLREWGWKAELEELEVLLNYPRELPSLQITRPFNKMLSLDEAPLATDKDSASSRAFGAFNGYGVSGVANGQVVYVNYGRPEDYVAIEKLGVDVKGKIVLARYGSLFRGLKVRNAQKRGAAGILIFSDPADDGFAKGDVYPSGRFRPGSAIQRGSVQFLSLGPGDPSTPFGPSVKGAKRLPFDVSDGFSLAEQSQSGDDLIRRGGGGEQAAVLSREEWEKATGLKRADYFATIPCLPISYDTAHEILKILAGPNVPSGWQGGLPLAYHVGPGPGEAGMSVSMDYQVRTIWNVIATITGAVEPDHWIMIGNHRDAWVYGAVDPGSGTAATLEMCRALGAAVKNGWKPRRTLMYASWDAEEYGLVGSTEWAEQNASMLSEKAVLMLNVDSAVSGPEFGASGVPSLRELVLDAAGAVINPRDGKSLRAAWTESHRETWAGSSPLVLADPIWDSEVAGTAHSETAGQGKSGFFPQMASLGSGSDFTAFLDHLAIPAVEVGFSGGYGVYHSIYDSFNWMEKFGDPEFLTHTMAARLYTVIAMRAAAADVVPIKFVPYGLALREHVDQLRLIHVRRTRKADPGKMKARPEFEGLSSLVEAVCAFQVQADELDRATNAVTERGQFSGDELAGLNHALAQVERAFLLDKGLPDRPWFKHAIYAPGLTTGYAAWPLPAIRQALDDDNKVRLAADLPATVERIKSATAALERARKLAQIVLEKH
jgi:N-acetylated-alpha-linked acidic dipeptidase